MSDDERRHFDNLILMCDECHNIIDNKNNEAKYPVALLKEWKKAHESERLYSYLNSRPSLLGIVVKALSEIDLETDAVTHSSMFAFRIDEKIEHNAIKRNRALINEWKVFYPKLNSLYQVLEDEGAFRKVALLQTTRMLYLRVREKYVDPNIDLMASIRSNADSILEDVQEELLLSVKGSCAGCSEEEVAFGISIVLVDAFMRCKILEEPPKG